MTNSNSHINGASLEDCHTNVFYVADLCSIKWCSYRIEHTVTVDPLDDPVISSFTKCMANDLLVTWRRVQKMSSSSSSCQMTAGGVSSASMHDHQTSLGSGLSHQPLSQSVTTYKELWVFWYGDDPDLNSLLSPHLLNRKLDDGNWETGLSYECRSLLFKAIHKLMERTLLSHGFVKLGKWFTQPYTQTFSDYEHHNAESKDRMKNQSSNLAFALNFFIHGESTICLTVSLRHRSPVHRLTHAHLLAASASLSSSGQPCGMPVVLSPFALAGHLTGSAINLSASVTRRFLELWKHFYPIDINADYGGTSISSGTDSTAHGLSNNSSAGLGASSGSTSSTPNERLSDSCKNKVPEIVDVVVGDIRLKYPSSYVLVADMDFAPVSAHNSTHSSAHLTSTYLREFVPCVSFTFSTPAHTFISSNCPIYSNNNPLPLYASAHSLLRLRQSSSLAQNLSMKAWHQSCMRLPAHESSCAPSSTNSALDHWNIADPLKRCQCSCRLCENRLARRRLSPTYQSRSLMSAGNGAFTRLKTCSWHRRGHGSIHPALSCVSPLPPLAVFSAASSVSYDGVSQSTNAVSAGITPITSSIDVPICSSSLPAANCRPGASPHRPLALSASLDSPLSVSAVLTPTCGPPCSSTCSPRSIVLAPSSVSSALPGSYVTSSTLSVSSNDLPSTTSYVYSTALSRFQTNPSSIESKPYNVNTHLQNVPQYPSATSSCQTKSDKMTICELSSADNSVNSSASSFTSLPSLYQFEDLHLWLRVSISSSKSLPCKTDLDNCDNKSGINHNGNIKIKEEITEFRGTKRPLYEPLETDTHPSMDRLLTPPTLHPPTVSACSRHAQSDKSNLFTSAGLEPRLTDLENLFDEDTCLSPTCSYHTSTTNSAKIYSHNSLAAMNTAHQCAIISDTCVSSSSEGAHATSVCQSGVTLATVSTSHSNTLTSWMSTSHARAASKCQTSVPTTSVGSTLISSVELSKIYPTPPSHEHNPVLSPGVYCTTSHASSIIHESTVDCVDTHSKSMPSSDVYSDSSKALKSDSLYSDDLNVYCPPALCYFVGAPRYSALENLPSMKFSQLALPTKAVYQPSWRRTDCTLACSSSAHTPSSSTINQSHNSSSSHISCKYTQNRSRLPTTEHHSHPVSSSHSSTSFYSHMPHSFGSRAGFQSPMSPVSFEASMRGVSSLKHAYHTPSPACGAVSTHIADSNAAILSSSSIPSGISVTCSVPEALLINVLLEDSLMNMFYDHNFDSCIMCVCNDSEDGGTGNIRGREASLYIPQPSTSVQSLRSYYRRASMHHQHVGAGITPSATAALQSADPIDCKCGFSAIVDRHLGYKSGLFPEDEVELTGERSERQYETPVTEAPSIEFLRLVQRLGSSTLYSSADDMCMLSTQFGNNSAQLAVTSGSNGFSHKHAQQSHMSDKLHLLEMMDAAEVTQKALELLRLVLGCNQLREANSRSHHGSQYVHRWPYMVSAEPQSVHDVLRAMRTILPYLQQSLHKLKPTKLWHSMSSSVHGPLTWRQFHKLAGRGIDCDSAPQPIPALLIGHDSEWLCASPFAVRHWEHLLLEPVSLQCDVAYLVVSPAGDNEFVVGRVRQFFRELSATYEACQLGRHVPIGSSCPEGVLRINRNAAFKLTNLSVDDWFNRLSDSNPVTSKLRLYAQYCRHYVAPYLLTSMERGSGTNYSTNASDTSRDKFSPSPMPPPATPETPSTPQDDEIRANTSDNSSSGYSTASSLVSSSSCSDTQFPHVVVYFVDPFSASTDSMIYTRLIQNSLLRAYMCMKATLPAHIQQKMCLQIVPLESILWTRAQSLHTNGCSASHRDKLRALSFTVFSNCVSAPSTPAPACQQPSSAPGSQSSAQLSSMTGFGPRIVYNGLSAQHATRRLSHLQQRHNHHVSPLYSLAPLPDVQRDIQECLSGCSDSPHSLPQQGQCDTLHCAYCLSHDLRWLICACTDSRGELRASTCLNVYVPNALRRRKISARRVALHKLMDWLFMLIVQKSFCSCRLVIGRFGRLGHGELKAWSSLLGRKSLSRFNQQLRDVCSHCSSVPASVPSSAYLSSSVAQAPVSCATDTMCCTILSACLISLQPDHNLRVFADMFALDLAEDTHGGVGSSLGSSGGTAGSAVCGSHTAIKAPGTHLALSASPCSSHPGAGSTVSGGAASAPLPGCPTVASVGVHGTTARDVSCSHILVFPTSATTQCAQTAYQPEHMSAIEIMDGALLPDIDEDTDGLTDNLFDSFNWDEPFGSAVVGVDEDITGSSIGIASKSSRDGLFNTRESNVEDTGTILQQPLALAYWPSTAPIEFAPSWFWEHDSCSAYCKLSEGGSRRNGLLSSGSVCLRSALHLHYCHTQSGFSDDMLHTNYSANNAKLHPLDSSTTTDVLRHVLENYNRLSWLVLDPVTRDRRSSLPVHMQLLLHLYTVMTNTL